MTFSDDLRALAQEAMDSKGWTKRQLAQHAYVTWNAVNDFFTGKHSSTLYIVDAIMGALDIRLTGPGELPELVESFRVCSTTTIRSTDLPRKISNTPLYATTQEMAEKHRDHLLEKPTAVEEAWIERRIQSNWERLESPEEYALRRLREDA